MILFDRPSRPDDDPPPAAPAVMRVYADPKLPELTLAECPDCVGYGYTGDEYTGCGCDTCDRTGQVEVCSGCLQRPWVVCGVEACECSQPGVHATQDRCEYVFEDKTPCPNRAEHEGLCLTCFLAGLEALEREDPEHPALSEEVVFGLSVGWLTAGEAGL